MNQRLDCYNLLLDVAKDVPRLIRRFPKGDSYLINQLKRALTSGVLNLTEGNGRYSIKERNRFFNISLGSIKEVIGAIELANAYAYIDNALTEDLIDKLNRSYYMIRKLRKFSVLSL